MIRVIAIVKNTKPYWPPWLRAISRWSGAGRPACVCTLAACLLPHRGSEKWDMREGRTDRQLRERPFVDMISTCPIQVGKIIYLL